MVIARRRRRRRRPAWVLAAALLSIVVLAVNAAASSGPRTTENRIATLAYLDQVRPEVEGSTRDGGDLADLRARAVEFGRARLARRLREVTDDERRHLRVVEGVDPPKGMETEHALLVATFAMRARSAATLQSAITSALDPRAPPPPTPVLVRTYADLLAADHSYRMFQESLPRTRDTVMPDSIWIVGPPPTEVDINALIASLRSSASLAPVRDVAVVLVALDPTPVANEGAASVLPNVGTLKLHVVVANIGNDDAKRVPVIATVTGPTGQSDTARQWVDLAPGERSTVTIGGLRLQPGAQSALVVRAGPIDGEGNVADNQSDKTLLTR